MHQFIGVILSCALFQGFKPDTQGVCWYFELPVEDTSGTDCKERMDESLLGGNVLQETGSELILGEWVEPGIEGERKKILLYKYL